MRSAAQEVAAEFGLPVHRDRRASTSCWRSPGEQHELVRVRDRLARVSSRSTAHHPRLEAEWPAAAMGTFDMIRTGTAARGLPARGLRVRPARRRRRSTSARTRRARSSTARPTTRSTAAAAARSSTPTASRSSEFERRKTPEELAAEKEAAAKLAEDQRIAAERKRHDDILMQSYPTEARPARRPRAGAARARRARSRRRRCRPRATRRRSTSCSRRRPRPSARAPPVPTGARRPHRQGARRARPATQGDRARRRTTGAARDRDVPEQARALARAQGAAGNSSCSGQ